MPIFQGLVHDQEPLPSKATTPAKSLKTWLGRKTLTGGKLASLAVRDS